MESFDLYKVCQLTINYTIVKHINYSTNTMRKKKKKKKKKKRREGVGASAHNIYSISRPSISINNPYKSKSNMENRTSDVGAQKTAQFSIGALLIAKDSWFLQADSKETNHNDQRYRLIWMFVRRTCLRNPLFLMLRLILYHYRNTPIQIYRKFHLQKLKNFQMENSDFFSYFCSKHRLWVLVRTASPRRF